MKKQLIACIVMLMGVTTASAQLDFYERGIFNHVGLNASIGTEGIGVGIAAPITDYMELGVGVNFMPSVKINGNVNVNFSIPTEYTNYGIPTNDKVKITGNLARTTMDVKLSVYPFGDHSSFFVAGGFSFGGEKIAKIDGHSDLVESTLKKYPELKPYFSAELDKYDIKFDDDGNVNGDIRVKKFRPYLGLGFGRMVPQKRISCRFEMGWQFMGNLKVYQDNKEVNINNLNNADDDLSKIIDKLTVYPVLKLTLTGRIF